MTLRKSGHGSLAGGPIMLRKGWPHHPAKIAARWPHDPANRQAGGGRKPDRGRLVDAIQQPTTDPGSIPPSRRNVWGIMEAAEAKIQRVLEGSKQFLVPHYQRRRSWEIEQWQARWRDLLELLDDPDAKPHFLGPIVTSPARSVPAGVEKCLPIDGQQRITTIVMLLRLLRDRARANGMPKAAERIQDLVTKRHEDGNEHHKLLPTQGEDSGVSDHEAFYPTRRRSDWFAGERGDGCIGLLREQNAAGRCARPRRASSHDLQRDAQRDRRHCGRGDLGLCRGANPRCASPLLLTDMGRTTGTPPRAHGRARGCAPSANDPFMVHSGVR